MSSLTNSRTALIDGKRVYLVKVAKAQRALIFLVLAALVVNIGLPVVMSAARGVGTPQALASLLLLGYLALLLGVGVAAIVQAARLARATGRGWGSVVLVAIGVFLPMIGIITLAVVNARANKVLKDSGVPVGFWGVPSAAMQALVVGACKACGYDLRGLPPGPCPECGTVNDAAT